MYRYQPLLAWSSVTSYRAERPWVSFGIVTRL
jgi:hypothetical protein